MTTLQSLGASDAVLASGPAGKRVLRWLPLTVGGLLGVGLLAAWVIPTLQQLNEANQRLTLKLEKTAMVPVLRQQLRQTKEQEQRVGVQRSQLLALIAGSGDLSTFLAQVDREAQRHGVQLDVLEPAAAAVPEAPAKGGGAKQQDAQQAAAAADPLVTATGLEAVSLTLVARGEFPNLLAFLRAIERLSLLVRQSDLALRVPETRRQRDAKTMDQQPPTELRLKVTLYGPRSGPQPPQS